MKAEGHISKFAPAVRENQLTIAQQSSTFADTSILSDVLMGVPEAVVILNSCRQIVYANQGVYRYVKPSVKALGLRPGEAMQCARAGESWGGCGTTEFCRTCGAVRAILTAQQGRSDVQECRIIRSGDLEPLDLRVWTTPLNVGGESFTVFAISDISNEKRRLALERIFFHDVLNAAGGLNGYAELLNEASTEQLDEFRDIIMKLSQNLIDEIESQRELRMAETSELSPEPLPAESISLINETTEMYRLHEVARGKRLDVESGSETVHFITDPALLRRVLGNMLKNALEATPTGGTVTIGYREGVDGPEFWVHNPSFMPRTVQLQMFQRSFSTKGVGRGLGTYSIKLLGERYLRGTVSFDTSLDDGTTFRIRLPHALELPPPPGL